MLSRAVVAYVSAMIISAGVASSAHATTFTYLLDNNTFADANGGPSLGQIRTRPEGGRGKD